MIDPVTDAFSAARHECGNKQLPQVGIRKRRHNFCRWPASLPHPVQASANLARPPKSLSHKPLSSLVLNPVLGDTYCKRALWVSSRSIADPYGNIYNLHTTASKPPCTIFQRSSGTLDTQFGRQCSAYPCESSPIVLMHFLDVPRRHGPSPSILSPRPRRPRRGKV